MVVPYSEDWIHIQASPAKSGLMVSGWEEDLECWMEAGHWTPMCLLPCMLEHRTVYVWNCSNRAVEYSFDVAEWKPIGEGTRVYQPVIEGEVESILDPKPWPLSLESALNYAITSDADHWSFIPCWEATLIPLGLAGEDPSDPAVLCAIAVARARAFDRYRQVSPEQWARDFNALTSASECIPAAYKGRDMKQLFEFSMKEPISYLSLSKLPLA